MNFDGKIINLRFIELKSYRLPPTDEFHDPVPVGIICQVTEELVHILELREFPFRENDCPVGLSVRYIPEDCENSQVIDLLTNEINKAGIRYFRRRSHLKKLGVMHDRSS